MRNPTEPSLVKWPFMLANALLLAAAYLIYRHSTLPMGFWQAGLAVLCVAGGASVSIVPYLLEYRVATHQSESSGRLSIEDQIVKLENVVAQMTAATGLWRAAREEVGQAAASAKEMTERTGAEVQGFKDFIQRIKESENARREPAIGKSRQLEEDWLQVLVQVLDHVYALQVGALRSGQPNLIQQISNFQDACRDAARRLGLTPFIAEPAEPFDPERHQLVDGREPVLAQSTVAETVATGYTFMGRLLRPALVRLSKSEEAQSAEGQSRDEPAQISRETNDFLHL